MIQVQQFTGGDWYTHSYFITAPEGNILVDAPEGADEFFASQKISALLLTHGHFDHIIDAARISRRHGCPVYIHPDSAPMLSEKGFFKKWSLPIEIETMQPNLLKESSQNTFFGLNFQIFLVPGHCPGSLCFFSANHHLLFGGDVLFREGVGRWDLPGGDRDSLIEGICTQLLVLPEETLVYPGHGLPTTIGYEKSNNPYLGHQEGIAAKK